MKAIKDVMDKWSNEKCADVRNAFAVNMTAAYGLRSRRRGSWLPLGAGALFFVGYSSVMANEKDLRSASY
jgi:hypothetical protein